jgi:hypothetical protein
MPIRALRADPGTKTVVLATWRRDRRCSCQLTRYGANCMNKSYRTVLSKKVLLVTDAVQFWAVSVPV